MSCRGEDMCNCDGSCMKTGESQALPSGKKTKVVIEHEEDTRSVSSFDSGVRNPT